MGRAKGGISAITADSESAFTSVFGTRRGSQQNGMYDLSGDPSGSGAAWLQSQISLLDLGQTAQVLEVLKKRHRDIRTLPRVKELANITANRIFADTVAQYSDTVESNFGAMGDYPWLEGDERDAILEKIRPRIIAAMALDPSAESVTNWQGQVIYKHTMDATRENMVRDLTRKAYGQGLQKVLLERMWDKQEKRVPEDRVRRILGPLAYQRLSEEAAGSWGEEKIPLQDYFNGNYKSQAPRPAVELSGYMDRIQWRDFLADVPLGTHYHLSQFDDNGKLYAPKSQTPPIRSGDDYKFARIIRKRFTQANKKKLQAS